MLNKLISVDCDPYTFIKVFRLLKEKETKKKGLEIATVFIASGLCYYGEYQESYAILSYVTPPRDMLLRLEYYKTLLSCCNNLEKVDELKRVYECISEISRTRKPKSPFKKQADTLLEWMDARQLFIDKNYAEYEKWLDKFTATVKTPCDKIICQYSKAKLDFALSRFESAKERCCYVIENGNNLDCVRGAQNLLKQIECKEQGV